MGFLKTILREIKKEIVSFVGVLLSIALFIYGESNDVAVAVPNMSIIDTSSGQTLIAVSSIAIGLFIIILGIYLWRKFRK